MRLNSVAFWGREALASRKSNTSIRNVTYLWKGHICNEITFANIQTIPLIVMRMDITIKFSTSVVSRFIQLNQFFHKNIVQYFIKLKYVIEAGLKLSQNLITNLCTYYTGALNYYQDAAVKIWRAEVLSGCSC